MTKVLEGQAGSVFQSISFLEIDYIEMSKYVVKEFQLEE